MRRAPAMLVAWMALPLPLLLLPAALRAAGYRAAQSCELHFSGTVTDTEVARMLTARYCSTLTDHKLREFGMERRGHDLWIAIAATLEVPVPSEAAATAERLLALVNAARAAGRRCGGKYLGPAAPLRASAPLNRAALEHSTDMARNGEFEHRGHDGSTPALRVRRAGYGSYRIVGENIAAGALTASQAMQGWLASPAHCENIMDARFREFGSAFAVNFDSAAVIYWTQDFATARR